MNNDISVQNMYTIINENKCLKLNLSFEREYSRELSFSRKTLDRIRNFRSDRKINGRAKIIRVHRLNVQHT